jgi:hypothetical protein
LEKTALVTLIPDGEETVRVSTYRTKNWTEIIALVMRQRKTGCFELHLSQGTVGFVKWRESQK